MPKIPKILPKQIKMLYPPKQNWQHSTKQQQQLYKQQQCSNNTAATTLLQERGGGKKTYLIFVFQWKLEFYKSQNVL